MQPHRGSEGQLLIAEYKQKLLAAAREDIACMQTKEVGNLFAGIAGYTYIANAMRDAESTLGQYGMVDASAFLREIHADILAKPAAQHQSAHERFCATLDGALAKRELPVELLSESQKQSIDQYLSIQHFIQRFADSLLEKRMGTARHPSDYEVAGKRLFGELGAMELGFSEGELEQRMMVFEQRINSLPISNQSNHIASQMAADWIESHRRDVRDIVDMLCVDLPHETRRDPAFLDYARELVRDQLLHHDRPTPGVAARILGREPQDVTRELADARHTVGELVRFTASAPRMHLEHVMREFISKGEQGLPQLQSRAR